MLLVILENVKQSGVLILMEEFANFLGYVFISTKLCMKYHIEDALKFLLSGWLLEDTGFLS